MCLFIQSVVIGAKLEDSTIALGASLLCHQEVTAASASAVEPTAAPAALRLSSFSEESILQERAKEAGYQAVDADIQALLQERNVLESFILESRQASSHRKFGHLIKSGDKSTLETLLNEYEAWLYNDCDPAVTTLKDIREKVGKIYRGV